MLRIKINNRATNKSLVVSLLPTMKLIELQNEHIQLLTSIPPHKQVLTIHGLGTISEGKADQSVCLADIISSGSIIQVTRSEQVNEEKEHNQQWSCQVCTLLNPNTNSNCGACTTPRSLNHNTKHTNLTNNSTYSSSSVQSTSNSFNKNTISTVQGTGSLFGFTARRRAVPSDNSCLFNAVAYLCDGKRGSNRIASWKENSPAYQLRNIVAERVRSNPKKFTTAILNGKSTEQYVTWIKNLKSWGGGIELSILAEEFHICIIAIDIQTLHPFVSSPKNATKACYVLYNGVHYDAIAFATLDNAALIGAEAINSENSDVTQINIEDRENATEMAIDLARQLKRMGSFTDLKKNFMVQCLQCFEKFQGRKECVKHAELSGHNQFGEIKW